MTIDDVVAIAGETLYIIIKVSAPILIASLVVGLIISIFQTVTSIQEQTLTFVPKIIGVFLALMLLGGWMMQKMVEFTAELWTSFSQYIHK